MKKIISILAFLPLTSCCTLSFQNVMTDGTASDVVDSAPSNDIKPETNASLELPKIP
jgi:hypothetical protein